MTPPPHLRVIRQGSSPNVNRSLPQDTQFTNEPSKGRGGDSLREIKNHVTHSGLAGDDSLQGTAVKNKSREGDCDIRDTARSLQLARTSRS